MATRNQLLEYLEHVKQTVATTGPTFIFVAAGGGEPSLCYSVGLWQAHHHSELVLFGLERQTSYAILSELEARIRKGARFVAGSRDAQTVASYEVLFLPIDDSRQIGVLNVMLAFYQQCVPVSQVVWPDAAGRFPHEPGYDTRFCGLQPILGRLPS